MYAVVVLTEIKVFQRDVHRFVPVFELGQRRVCGANARDDAGVVPVVICSLIGENGALVRSFD
jgi:hypothetical protein